MNALKWPSRRPVDAGGETPLGFVVLMLLLLSLIWAATLHWTTQDRAKAEHDAQVAAQNLSGVYGVQMLRALRELDLTINVVRYACEQKGLKHALSNLETDLLVPTALVFVIKLTDPRGQVVATNNGDPLVSAVDQPYFRFFRDQPRLGDSLYVGPAVFNQQTQKSRMQFARRITTQNGQFAGVVSVSIDPEYFTSDYEVSRMGQHGSIGVIGPLGHLMAARSGDRVSRDEHKTLKQLIPSDAEPGTARLMLNPWDGVRRYTAIEHLEAFGITTVVGLAEDEQLLAFRRSERIYLWQASFVSVVVLILGLLGRQLLRSRSRVRKAQETYLAASEASRDATYVLHSVCDASGAIIDFRLTDTNSRGVALLGLTKAAMVSQTLSTLLPQDRQGAVFAVLCMVVETGKVHDQEWENHEPSVKAQWLHAQVVRAADGVVAIVRDISARKRSEAELVRRNVELTALNTRLTETHEQLVQSEKLASIGLLAAGVAHEINNPIGFVLSNIGTLDRYLASLFQMLAVYQEAEQALSDPAMRARIQALQGKVELDYLKEDIPALMRETKDGIERVRKIVQDLKNFSHVDSQREWQRINLHEGIDSTLNVVNNEIKYKADVVKEYGDIPLVECLPSEINQVVMNLLVNAAHAIGDQRGTITVRTGLEGEQVWLEVQDTGCGIAPDNLAKIFDPFFTTKPVGKGTGLGLSLSYGILKKHGGHMSVSSVVGQGTTFRVAWPVAHVEPATAVADTEALGA